MFQFNAATRLFLPWAFLDPCSIQHRSSLVKISNSVALSHIYGEIKNLMLKRLCTEITTKFWGELELRLMVVISLIVQLAHVIFGNLRRRYIGKRLPCVAITVRLLYLLADWMATVVLSTLFRGDVKLKNGLAVFWTPFLLWHLGSPHNITAYSLEDNEMWLRHFLGMVFQVSIRHRPQFYGCSNIPCWSLQVRKRIWALRSARDKQLINSLEPRKKGKNASPEENKKIRIGLSESTINDCFRGKANVSELKLLHEAYSSFLIFKPLFLGIPFELSAKFYDDMVYIKSKKSADDAFKLVGTELGYLYDLLFSKMPIHYNHHKVSSSLRALCFLSAVSSLIAFSAIMDKSVHLKVDIVITIVPDLGDNLLCIDISSNNNDTYDNPSRLALTPMRSATCEQALTRVPVCVWAPGAAPIPPFIL
ncbi:protein of unknown function DUF4220 - like 1 [Theobroma cacao]|nr:protein of unknown function DUF4220 - like 1 [Theobroma cacao]